MSIDFHRLMEPIDINRLIFIDYIDYIDCFPMIDFHRLDPSGETVFRRSTRVFNKYTAGNKLTSKASETDLYPNVSKFPINESRQIPRMNHLDQS